MKYLNMVNSGELFQEDADELNVLFGNVDRVVTGNAVDRLKSYGTSYERTVSLLENIR